EYCVGSTTKRGRKSGPLRSTSASYDWPLRVFADCSLRGAYAPSAPTLAQEQGNQDRRSENGRNNATLELRGANNEPSHNVGNHQNNGTGQGRGRQNSPVVGAGKRTDQMRDSEPNEAYRPGGRDRSTRGQNHADSQNGSHERRVHPQTPGGILA